MVTRKFLFTSLACSSLSTAYKVFVHEVLLFSFLAWSFVSIFVK